MQELQKINFKKYNMRLNFYGMVFKLESAQVYNDFIRISATTSNDNYVLTSKIIENVSHFSKKDIIISSQLKLINMFPIDFDFNMYDMNVLFSVESIVGDFEKGLLQYERKEKIKKIK